MNYHNQPLNPAAIAYADKMHKTKYGEDKIDTKAPSSSEKIKGWWAAYDKYLASKRKKTPQQKPSQPKSTIKPVLPCKQKVKGCALLYTEASCSHYPNERKYLLKTQNFESVLEVKAGSDKHTWDKITFKTEVEKIDQCKMLSSFYSVRGPGLFQIKSGPSAQIDVMWPGDLKQWYKYFFPFTIDPVNYSIRSSACYKKGVTDIDIHVYPDIELKVTGTIDLRKGSDHKRESGVEIEYKIAKQKIELGDIVAKVNKIISIFSKTKKAMDELGETLSHLGVRPKMVGPTVGLELTAQLDEDPNGFAVRKKGAFNLIGQPLIGIEVEADIIRGVIRSLQAAATATGIGIIVTGLLHVIEFGRAKLGAGLYFLFNGGIKGAIGAEIMDWPQFKPKGKMGGDIVMTLTARASKPGSNFLLRVLSHARVGGQGGLEIYLTGAGFDKKGAYVKSEFSFTGLCLFYGKAKSPKTTRVADNGQYYLIEKKEFWKDKINYFWDNSKK